MQPSERYQSETPKVDGEYSAAAVEVGVHALGLGGGPTRRVITCKPTVVEHKAHSCTNERDGPGAGGAEVASELGVKVLQGHREARLPVSTRDAGPVRTRTHPRDLGVDVGDFEARDTCGGRAGALRGCGGSSK